jgi:uroporphyrinogen-III synthase
LAIKSILISQPKPDGDKSPYYDLRDKYNIKVDFRSFIKVEGVDGKDFRSQKVNLSEHTAIILTSKVAADHFFRIAEDARFEVPESMKYFCISEAVAKYLQKFIPYRKRKIFFGAQTIDQLAEVMKKHKNEKYLLPCTDILRDSIPETLTQHKVNFTKVILYRTVAADLSDLENVYYDMLVFSAQAELSRCSKISRIFNKIAPLLLLTEKALPARYLRIISAWTWRHPIPRRHPW